MDKELAIKNITYYKYKIEKLEQDIFYVRNNVTVSLIQKEIDNVKKLIKILEEEVK